LYDGLFQFPNLALGISQGAALLSKEIIELLLCYYRNQ
jgi:hypothetical protein